MIFKDVEFHNIAEAHPVAGSDGVRLQRIPEPIRLQLEKAQNAMLSPANAEIRFVSEGPLTRVTLSSAGTAKLVVFRGVFQEREVHLIGEIPQTIEVGSPERLGELDPIHWRDMPFAPHVKRLMLAGDAVVFHGIQGDGVRPPHPNELPALRYLAYGTSITHGAAASAPHLTYVAQTARRLGVDLINLGVGGSAYCEPALSDYIAMRSDWHFATLALSVNMIGAGFTLDEFHRRVSYMINAVAGSNPHRPVACITIYPHSRDWGAGVQGPHGTPDEYRQRLRDAVSACPHPNVHLIEGSEILTDMGGLTPDLVHPADNGMIQMGENLAARLKPLIQDLC